MSDEDVSNYNKIKTGLERLRLLVEQSELWVFKKKETTSLTDDLTATSITSSSSKLKHKSESESNLSEDCCYDKKDIENKISRIRSAKMLFLNRKNPTTRDEMSGDEHVLKELNDGPEMDESDIDKYKELYKILFDMIKFCVNEESLLKTARKNDQRLLRNMGVHNSVLELTKITYSKQEDKRMRILMRTAHEFLQNFCYENPHNQTLLHELLDLTHYPSNEWEAQTATQIFKDNILLCNGITERLIQNFVHALEHENMDGESKIAYLEFLQTVCVVDGHEIKKNQDMIIDELMNSEIIHFSNDKMSIDDLCLLMQNKQTKDLNRHPLILFHVNLVKVLINCTFGKNTFTEIKCHTILSLEDIERVLTNKYCLPIVKESYIKFLYHCHIDTENETKEIFTTSYIWSIFESFIQDLTLLLFNNQICQKTLETNIIDNFIQVIIGYFSNSQFNHIPFLQASFFLIFLNDPLI